ncbi:MAG: hypothetical protein U0790_22850 [Isosphaeraceae bacterium]
MARRVRLVIEVGSVAARTGDGGHAPEELLFVTRERQADATFKHDYSSNGRPRAAVEGTCSCVQGAHRIEECIKTAKGEAGLADYQVRN